MSSTGPLCRLFLVSPFSANDFEVSLALSLLDLFTVGAEFEVPQEASGCVHFVPDFIVVEIEADN